MNWKFVADRSSRLDKLLKSQEIPGAEWISRASWDWLVEHGHVLSNGRPMRKQGAEIPIGSNVEINFPSPIALQPAIDPAPLAWISPDKSWGIFSKGIQVPSHPLRPWEQNTLANQVVKYLEIHSMMKAEEFLRLGEAPILEGGLVQRLDSDTSGLLSVAFTREAKAELKNWISQHGVEKTYWTIVHGNAPKEGKFDLSFNLNATKVKVENNSGPNRAELEVRILKNKEKFYLAQVKTRFGFRHIIRASMAHLGCPLVGDAMYGSEIQKEYHLLHAQGMDFSKVNSTLAHPQHIEDSPSKAFLDSLLELGLN